MKKKGKIWLICVDIGYEMISNVGSIGYVVTTS